MAANVPLLTFSNGQKIPILGLGTWKSKPGEVAQAVKDAIDVGYRHIDCALAYCNEHEIGEAIRQKISEGVVKREDLFITSKLWNTFHREDLVKVGIQKTLKDLGLKYLDLYLMHWPMAYKVIMACRLIYDYCNKIIEDYNETMKVEGEIKFLTLTSDIVDVRNTTFKNSYGNNSVICLIYDYCNKIIEDYSKMMKVEGEIKFLTLTSDIVEEDGELFPKDENDQFILSDASFIDAWKAMEKLVDEGLTKSIGLSNFNSQQINEVLAVAKIKPVTVQVECHPYLNQKKLKEFCESKGILLTAYSPLGSADRPWATKDDPLLLEEPKILAIAEKYKKTSAQIVIKYQIQRGVIVIPKSVTKSRIISNFDVFDFTLSDEDIKVIDSLDNGERFCHLRWVKHHKYYPFHIEY